MKSSNRKTLLLEKLEQNGLKFREDSELYRQYIDNIRDDIDFIIETMLEMDFYIKYTMYKQIYKKEKMDGKKQTNEWTDEKEENVRNIAKVKAAKNFWFRNKNSQSEMDKMPNSIKSKLNLN